MGRICSDTSKKSPIFKDQKAANDNSLLKNNKELFLLISIKIIGDL
jgi:hypothetical protein